MRTIERSVELLAPAAQVFAALHTPSAIRQWWGASRAIVIPQRGGTWAAAWGADEDDPEYVSAATLTRFDPPRRLRFENFQYRARDGGLPFEATFVTEFVIEPRGDGCLLKVRQEGFPDDPVADEFYEGCHKGWTNTFDSLQRFFSTAASSR